ncbi:facilitated trehalose transporter Tret1 [Anabrus simplex]|uniref:facilitated trehalose transporter Tret1 n=1 Tax=Anabrus simplex TaxID=316456 RepID=UPI0035A33BC4
MSCVKVQPPETQTVSRAPQFTAAFIVNLIAFTSGFSTGWPATAIPYLEGPESPIPLTPDQSSWIISLLCLVAAFTTPFAAFLPDKIGRKKTGYLVAVSHLICWTLITLATNVIMLYIARTFSGLCSVGVFIFAPTYVVEIAVDQIRGTLGTFVIALCNSGIALSYVIGWLLTYEQVCYVNLCLPVIFILLFYWLPETPKYLIYSGKFEEAKKSLQWFRGRSYDITAEYNQIKASFDNNEPRAPLVPLKEIFASKSILRGLFIVLVLAANHQLCGIYPVLSYTVTIFRESGSDISPNLSSVIVGSLLVVGNVTASFLIDRAGRRRLLIISDSIMSVSLMCIGVYFYLKSIGADVSSIGWLPVTSLSIFVVALSIGVGPMLYLVISEIIPPQIKYVANAMALTLVWFIAFLGAKFFNNLADLIGVHSTFWIFSLCCLLGMLVIIFQLPETKGKSLKEIERLLEGKCKKQEKIHDLPNV